MATEISKSAPDMPLAIRIEASVIALAICWIVSGVGFGVYLRDVRGSVLFFIWSVPFFVAGWVLVGIPVIAMGNRILRIPKIFLGIVGAIAGAFIILAPFFVIALINQGTIDFSKWEWSFQKGGWTIFGPAISASGLVLYAWLLSRATKYQPNSANNLSASA